MSFEFEIPAAEAVVLACANLQRIRTHSAVVEGTDLDDVDELKRSLSPLIVDEVVVRSISLVTGRELFQDLATDLQESTLIGGAYDPRTGSFLVEIGIRPSEDLVAEVTARADELFGDVAFRIERADSAEGPG